MHLLKQSTAASVLVGPVLDANGAVYTGAVIGNFTLTKNGTSATMASAATATHDHNGMYVIALTTGNTDTLGRLVISVNAATYTMPAFRFSVLTSATFDALITNAADASGGLLDAKRIGGTTQTGRDLGVSVLLSSGTGTGQVKLSSGYVAPNWGDVGNPTTTVALSNTTVGLTAGAVQAIWDAATTALVTAGSIGKRILDFVTNLVYAAPTTPPTAAAIRMEIDTNSTQLTGIKAKSDLIPASPAAIGSAMTLTTGERTAVADEVEDQIIDETDSEKVLEAITNKIASVNPSLAGLTLGAIAIAVRDVNNDSPAADSLGEAINEVKSKTNNLPDDPADASDVATAFDALGGMLLSDGSTWDEALVAARAQGRGRWVLDTDAKTLTLYLKDGTTELVVFDLDSATAPTTRTPQ